MKLSFRTSQRQSLGYTSLELGIAYTDGVLNEDQISSACQLAIDTFVHSISQSVVRNSRSRQNGGVGQVNQQESQRDKMDEVLKQILCESAHLSTVS